MELTLYQVDAFTQELYKGNPAAVCPLTSWLPDALLQSIALENNLSETAFTVPKDKGFELRWFTPKIEVDLCGHATLATAHVFFEHLHFQGDEIHFSSKSGPLSVAQKDGRYYLNFPARPGVAISAFDSLIAGMGTVPSQVYRSDAPYILTVYDTEAEIQALSPNYGTLASIDALLVIATAAGNRSDFVSRVFAPSAGINEDPVTGAAHTMLIPYWSNRLGKKKLHAYQISARKGELFCEDLGEKVLIGGHAITYMVGRIQLPD